MAGPGFRDRAAAALIDALLVYVLCRGLEALSLAVHVYLPFELTYLILALVYAALGRVRWGATLGEAAVGARAATPSRVRVGLARAAVVAGLGAGSLIAGLGLAGWVALGLEVLPMVPRAASPRSARGPIETTLVEEASEADCASWLAEHGRPPAAFVLEQCRRYPLVVVGERHWERGSLAFLCALLPELRESGVRCLAMEWLLAEDDALVERLVTTQAWDPELALEIARHHPWRAWGWKGYTDALESAWRVNAALGPREAKLRVCGLDLPIDLPSMALAGLGDQAVAGPAWERLRAVRMIRELPKALMRDAFMARQVERQVLERGERALVWVGAAHSTVRCRGPGDATGWGRMAYLLARKHPGSVTQVYLHDAFGPGPRGTSAENGVSDLVERLMERRGNVPLGWEVTGSPFEALRDPHHWSFGSDPARSFGDLACNYLFLAPRSRLGRCEWLAGYVTPRMLAANLPFYEAIGRRTGTPVSDTASADRALSRQ